jgi:hypothetical protein
MRTGGEPHPRRAQEFSPRQMPLLCHLWPPAVIETRKNSADGIPVQAITDESRALAALIERANCKAQTDSLK